MTAITATTPNTNVIAPIPQNSNTSLIRNAYEYFQNPENSSLLKICSAALAALATLAIGFSLGSVLLFTSMMTSVVVLTAGMESERVADQATIQAQKREIAHLQVAGLIGGELTINATFAELNLGDRESATGAIDFLQLDEVRDLRNGVDKYGRHFYAIPLEKRSDRSRHLIVFYEKYVSGDTWEVVGPPDLLQGPITDEGKAIIGPLVNGVHPAYRYSPSLMNIPRI